MDDRRWTMDHCTDGSAADLYRPYNPKSKIGSAPRGQEFVLDVDLYPEALAWVYHLFAAAGER